MAKTELGKKIEVEVQAYMKDWVALNFPSEVLVDVAGIIGGCY